MAETVLAVLGLVGPTYKAISAAYHACKPMQNYESDMCECLGNLDTQWVIFEGLMHRPLCDFKQPFDWNDENDKTTKAIMEQLRNLKHQFSVCWNILQKTVMIPGQAVFLDRPHLSLGTRIGQGVMAATLTTGIGSTGVFFPRHSMQKPTISGQDSPKLAEDCSKIRAQGSPFRSVSSGFGKHTSAHNYTSTWSRVTWALHGKSEMEKAVVRIRHLVSDLRDLLTLRESWDLHKAIPVKTTATTPQPRANSMRLLYLNVHRALCEVNKRSKRPVSFAICALEDLEDNWNLLDNGTKLRLRLGHAAMWLQMHLATEESTFWMAEVRLSDAVPLSDKIELPIIESLDHFPLLGTAKGVDEHYEVGALLNKYDPTDKIHVFAHTNPCRRRQTLREILALESSRSRLSDAEVLKLCLTIVVAHDNMFDVRKTTSETNLDSYVFYHSPDSSTGESVQDFDVTYPYVHFGYGQPLACSKTMGLSRSLVKPPGAGIAGLGAVLLQLAARDLVPGIDGSSLEINASPQTLIEKTLERIEVRFGDGLTSAIEACLKGDARTEAEIVRKTTEVLKHLQVGYSWTN